MPETGSPEFIGETASLYDLPWQYWQKFAHNYGSGPVTVAVRDPRTLAAAAVAVRRWNRAVGMAVFQLVPPGTGADVVIRTQDGDRPETGGEGGPRDWYAPGKPSQGLVKIFRPDESQALYDAVKDNKWARYVVAHELGHTIGLGHSEGGGIMGTPQPQISRAEATRVRGLVGPQVEEGIAQQEMETTLRRRRKGGQQSQQSPRRKQQI